MDTNPTFTTRRRLLGTGAALLAGSLAGCLGGFDTASRSQSEAWSFAPGAIQSVTVRNTSGAVAVTAGQQDRVEVTVTRRARSRASLADVDVSADVTDGVLTVTASVPGRVRADGGPRADVDVTVPAGRAGPAISTVEVDAGSVTLDGTRGDTRVRVGAGEVSASAVDGYLSLLTGAGRITARDVTGLDEVRTGLGRVEVDLLDVRTDTEIGTDMGAVAVGVAADLDADVLAECDGALDSDLALVDARSGVRRLAGRLNHGGPRLHVFSGLGDVSLWTLRRRT